MTPDERAVLDALDGRRLPITQADLAYGLGLRVRNVQEAILGLRLAGHPIVADGEGMRLTTDPDEVAACALALRKRALTQLWTARAMRRVARTLRADPTLWGAS
jgi:hypothetical protein